LAVYIPVLGYITHKIDDPRLQGVIASLLLFFPASFVLGAVSPYLARLRNTSVETTGTTIASLSALNSVGGIAGTFATGFFFFGYLGSREALLVVAVLLLAASWLAAPRRLKAARAGATLLILMVAAATAVPPAGPEITVDTATATYKVYDAKYEGRRVRVLQTGPEGIQSGVEVTGAHTDLIFSYTRKMAELAALSPERSKILILGGGAFTLPANLP
jgi:hypothetical protein